MAQSPYFVKLRCRFCAADFGDPEYSRDFLELDKKIRKHVAAHPTVALSNSRDRLLMGCLNNLVTTEYDYGGKQT